MQRYKESGSNNIFNNIYEKPRNYIQRTGDVDRHIWCFLLFKGKICFSLYVLQNNGFGFLIKVPKNNFF